MRFAINVLLAAVAVMTAMVVWAPSGGAQTFGSGTYGTCTYGTCGISLSTSGSVQLNISPTTGGAVTIASDTVTVETGASTGYSLQLASAAVDTALASGPSTIAASSGTVAAPQVLAVNTWGYRIDSAGGFGGGPTSAVTNAANSSLTFAGLTALGSPVTLKTTTVAAPTPGETTTIWYGAKVTSSKPSGTYSRTVTYTATVN